MASESIAHWVFGLIGHCLRAHSGLRNNCQIHTQWSWWFKQSDWFAISDNYTLNVRSRGKQLVLFSWESWCFPRRSQGKHQDSRENKTIWFAQGPDIKCFVIFLDFHFNSNKRITGANQNSRLGTYNNPNLILKTTEWMIYKSTFLILSASFSSTSCCFSSGMTWKIVAF